MRSSETVFISPEYNIDNRIYFSDITISKRTLFEEYESLYLQGRYDDALALIENENFYGAWLLNLLENRLYNMENYVWSLNKPIFGSYQATEPIFTEEPEIYIWINSDEE